MVAVIKPKIIIQKMQQSDLAAVTAIEKNEYHFPWSEGVFNDCLRANYQCRIVKINNVIIGYGILSTEAQEAHILNLCVAAHYQRLGIASQLLKQLMHIARWYRVTRMFLEVRVSNIAAQNLYNLFGFKQIGVRKHYYRGITNHTDKEDALVLAYDFEIASEC